MTELDRLNETADKALSGLQAGPELKYRILHEAASTRPRHSHRRALISALCGAMVLVLAIAVVPGMLRNRQDRLISSIAAGTSDATQTAAVAADAGVSGGSVQKRSSTVSASSIWAGKSSDFPMIVVNGRYYRMLSSPSSVSSSLCGSSLGTVQEYTTEPALSSRDVIASNTAAAGTEVYAAGSMGNTLVVAQVDGVNRVFQRVGFSGNAVVGSESLADTLQISGHVTSMALDGVGKVTDASALSSLTSALLNGSSYKSAGQISGGKVLLIGLDNGLTVQLMVKDSDISGCGTWNCPTFLDAFTAAVG